MDREFDPLAGKRQLKPESISRNELRKHEDAKTQSPGGKRKRPLSAYNIFFRDEHQRLTTSQARSIDSIDAMPKGETRLRELPARPAEVTQQVAANWRTLAPKYKAEYEARASEAKKKHLEDLASWEVEKEDRKQRLAAKAAGNFPAAQNFASYEKPDFSEGSNTKLLESGCAFLSQPHSLLTRQMLSPIFSTGLHALNLQANTTEDSKWPACQETFKTASSAHSREQRMHSFQSQIPYIPIQDRFVVSSSSDVHPLAGTNKVLGPPRDVVGSLGIEQRFERVQQKSTPCPPNIDYIATLPHAGSSSPEKSFTSALKDHSGATSLQQHWEIDIPAGNDTGGESDAFDYNAGPEILHALSPSFFTFAIEEQSTTATSVEEPLSNSSQTQARAYDPLKANLDQESIDFLVRTFKEDRKKDSNDDGV